MTCAKRKDSVTLVQEQKWAIVTTSEESKFGISRQRCHSCVYAEAHEWSGMVAGIVALWYESALHHWDDQLVKRKGLFWLMLFGALAHDWFAPLLWVRQNIMVGSCGKGTGQSGSERQRQEGAGVLFPPSRAHAQGADCLLPGPASQGSTTSRWHRAGGPPSTQGSLGDIPCQTIAVDLVSVGH